MTAPELDPFSRRQASGVSQRWNEARRDHQQAADLAWLGMILTRFTSHELGVLERAGSLSDNDRRLLAQARQVAL